jgi:hypothetical protein
LKPTHLPIVPSDEREFWLLFRREARTAWDRLVARQQPMFPPVMNVERQW